MATTARAFSTVYGADHQAAAPRKSARRPACRDRIWLRQAHSWTPGRPGLARLAASPLILAASPRHKRTISAPRQISRAAAIPVVSVTGDGHAWRNDYFGLRQRRREAFRIVTGSAALPAIAHGPSISARASASGPMSAMRRRVGESGNTWSLVRTTIARRARSRASSRPGLGGAWSGRPRRTAPVGIVEKTKLAP